MPSLGHVWRGLRVFASRHHPRPYAPWRRLSSTTPRVLDPSVPVEEETLPWYDPADFYPVRVGDIFQSRYQVVGKLGYGGYSTAWLCRDLKEERHVTVKICAQCHIAIERELAAFKHLNSLPKTEHVGRKYIRTWLDQFELTEPKHTAADSSQSTENPTRTFQCIVLKPMAISIREFRDNFVTKQLPKLLVKLIVIHVLLALDYLHQEAKLVHADIQEKNILLALDDTWTLQSFEDRERSDPVARKLAGDRIIYLSRAIDFEPMKYGEPTLCDFGEARFGDTTYRAPEVVLDIPWDEKVDIWSVGVMIWDMFEGTNMFKVEGGPEKETSALYHLAHMVSLLGPPPVDFLQRSDTEVHSQYFDAQGNWIGKADLPDDSLELSEKRLEGEDKAQFLRFVRRMVTWKPEDRPSARELLQDPWLRRRDDD